MGDFIGCPGGSATLCDAGEGHADHDGGGRDHGVAAELGQVQDDGAFYRVVLVQYDFGLGVSVAAERDIVAVGLIDGACHDDRFRRGLRVRVEQFDGMEKPL